MSTYSNKPQQNHWELWFFISVILSILILVWGSIAVELPVIYDGILFLTLVNLIYCIYKSSQK